MFLPAPRPGTDVTPEPLEPPPIVPPASGASALVPAPPVVPATYDAAAGASRGIDKNDASATSKFDVASLSSSRIDASDVPTPYLGSSMADADAAASARPADRDSAPSLPAPPADRAPIKLPGVAPIEGSSAAPSAGMHAANAGNDDVAARFGATGGANPALPAVDVPRVKRGALDVRLRSPRWIAAVGGALVVVVALVFAFVGGDATPSATTDRQAPSATERGGASGESAGPRAGDTGGATNDRAADTAAGMDDGVDDTAAETDDRAGDSAGAVDDSANATAAAADDNAGGAGDTAADTDDGADDGADDTAAETGDGADDRAAADHTQRAKPAVKRNTKRASTKPAIRRTSKATNRKSTKRAGKKKPVWDPDALFPTRRKKK